MPGISIKTTISEKELPKFKTESDLRGCAINGNNGGTVQATVDGKNLQNLDRYRVQSPLFNVTFADHNIFGAPAGITQAVSDGWWVFLQPLAPGSTCKLSQFAGRGYPTHLDLCVM